MGIKNQRAPEFAFGLPYPFQGCIGRFSLCKKTAGSTHIRRAKDKSHLTNIEQIQLAPDHSDRITKMPPRSNRSRRSFLKHRDGMVAAAAAPPMIPSSALKLDRATVPSERIRLAGIGMGGQGRHDPGAVLFGTDGGFRGVGPRASQFQGTTA